MLLRPLTRVIQIGGKPKLELLAELKAHGVQLNEAGEALFAHSGFSTSPMASEVQIVEIAVGDLGFKEGATTEQIVERALQQDWGLCPLELGPFWRLQYLNQLEGCVEPPETKHRAPAGSVTVLSPAVSADDQVPKGFYLRRINGVDWLRGYWALADHLWGLEDRVVLVKR